MSLFPWMQAAYYDFLEARDMEREGLRLKERLHVEKFDHLVEPPRLFEYQIRENGVLVYLERWDETEGRMKQVMLEERS